MKNIYFLPAWGQSSKEMLETLKLQTPDQTGTWKSISATTKLFEADAFILQDYTTPEMESFLKLNDLWEQTYYFSREVPGAGPIKEYSQVKSFSYLKESSYLYTKWAYPNESNGGVSISYNSLMEEAAPEKSKNLLCIQSSKRILSGHRLRLKFIEKFCSQAPQSMDLYGNIIQDAAFKKFSNKFEMKENNKFLTSQEYKYCLAFDNGQYRNYFGTQFTDALLSWCIPIYWGAPNIEEFFPADSFITFDTTDEDEINRIVELINDPDDYAKRLPALTEARNLVLKKYNIWDTINEVVTTGKSTWGDF
tara:strand:+ start:325 stop:1245 length:921 start_codon:yes stop_codon:yes gene_type:complete